MSRAVSKENPRQSVQKLRIDPEDAGQRLDNFLLRLLKGLPKSRVYRIIRKGEVRVSGKRKRPDYRLQGGDEVRVPPIAHLVERDSAVGSFHDLDSLILFENSHLVIINKPAGMAVHGGSGVSAGVIESLRAARPEGNRLALVHRLDRGTSGCLMVAKRRSYLRLLQDALRAPGTIQKTYLALVEGNWPETVTAIDAPLLTTSLKGRERFTRVDSDGKPALTQFRSIARGEGHSLIAAKPVTGRTHQIRVHARWNRHPIVGDDRYGGVEQRGRLMLHAHRLEIPELDKHAAVSAEAPVDDAFKKVLRSSIGTDKIIL